MCLTPVTLNRKYANRYYQNTVPCGKCLECIKDKQNEYIVRSLEEARKYDTMVFFTLTYSPEALPVVDDFEIDEETGEYLKLGEVQTLCRADVRKWKLSYEQYYRRKKMPLKYSFLIKGEYGPKTQRPHYHGLIFGLSREVVNDIMYRWKKQYGYVVFKFIPPVMADREKVARYCSKYMVKDQDWNVLPRPWCEKPRPMTSKEYGMPKPERWKKWQEYYTCQDIVKYDINNPVFASNKQQWYVANEIIRRKKYKIGNGKEFKLPAYYVRKLFYTPELRKITDQEGNILEIKRSMVASPLQRLVTYAAQYNYTKSRDDELFALAAEKFDGDMSKAIMFEQAREEDNLLARAETYAANNRKYMVKSIC